MQGRGQVEPDEDVLGDAVAFAGVAKFPARVKCALLPWMAFKDAAARAGGDGERTGIDRGRRQPSAAACPAGPPAAESCADASIPTSKRR